MMMQGLSILGIAERGNMDFYLLQIMHAVILICSSW